MTLKRYGIRLDAYASQMEMDQIEKWISDTEILPADLRITIETLAAAELDTGYRGNGWTIRQLVHNCQATK